LFCYRVAPHATTGVPPAELLMQRKPRSRLDLLRPQLSTKVHVKQSKQKLNHDKSAPVRILSMFKIYPRDQLGYEEQLLEYGDHWPMTWS